MKDPATRLPVETEEEGYELSLTRVRKALGRIKAIQVPVLHLNAARAVDVEEVRGQLARILRRMRQTFIDQIRKTDEIIRDLAKNHEEAKSLSAHEAVRVELASFLKRMQNLPNLENSVYIPVIHTMRGTHVQTIRASLRRRGEWQYLDVFLHLGAAAGTSAKKRTNRFFVQLDGLIDHLLAKNDLSPTHGFLQQMRDNIGRWCEEYLEAIRRAGREMLRDPLYENLDLWNNCIAEWSKGAGFRERIIDHFDSEEGFQDPGFQKLLAALEVHIRKEWEARVVANLRKLCNI